MSTALKTAIYARLAGIEVLTGAGLTAQQDLAALLGTDPDTGEPAVHHGNHSQVAVYPAVTFRQNTGSVVSQFGTSGIAVDNTVWDFEYWSNTNSATVISDIADAVERLLDQRRSTDGTGAVIVPGLAVDNTHGRIFRASAFVPYAELYDSNLRASFGLMRYKIVEARF